MSCGCSRSTVATAAKAVACTRLGLVESTFARDSNARSLTRRASSRRAIVAQEEPFKSVHGIDTSSEDTHYADLPLGSCTSVAV